METKNNFISSGRIIKIRQLYFLKKIENQKMNKQSSVWITLFLKNNQQGPNLWGKINKTLIY